jgi:hypothetical protein
MTDRILLIAGCSHAAGAEIDGTADSMYNRQHSFGNLLAAKMERTPINIALHGAANSGIARSVLNWFDQYYKKESMDVYVLVSWTESSRLEVASKKRPFAYQMESGSPNADWFDWSCNEYYRLNFGWKGSDSDERELTEVYHRFMAQNETMLESWCANYVLQLQYMFKSLQIKYIMCNTMHMFNHTDRFVNQYVKLIDDRYYYQLRENQDASFYWKYKTLGYENPNAKYWHHGEEPHRLYAEELFRFIGE